MKTLLCVFSFVLLLPAVGWSQINTGSDGHDGAFNPTTNTVINLANHPDGIYQYSSVNIRSNVTVTFIPNANNTPVVWLVQGNAEIDGTIDLSGRTATSGAGAVGGPGGYRGGDGGSQPTMGQGPGGGMPGTNVDVGGNASYGTLGVFEGSNAPAGSMYGNVFLVPLLGGSGGGGCTDNLGGGGGGGGAILVAASGTIQLNGEVSAYGGNNFPVMPGGYGSGGAVRLVAPRIIGSGTLLLPGAFRVPQFGAGRIRFDCYENAFGGQIAGAFTQGFQPIILTVAGTGTQLAIASVAGAPVAASPIGQLATPDVIVPAQQANPIPVVVNCVNVPLNTPVTVTVKPMNGPALSAVGPNSAGTLASSTATVSLNLPRGGGLIYATATLPVGPAHGASVGRGARNAGLAAADHSSERRLAAGLAGAEAPKQAASQAALHALPLSVTGLTTDGERFAQMEIKATLGGGQQVAYITESGKRFVVPR